MACTRCGECCTNLTFVMPNVDVLREFYSVRGCMVRNDGSEIAVIVPFPCPYLKHEGTMTTCVKYKQGPKVCREFICEKAMEK